jgi:outer membrane protein assembly factor BamB
MILVALGALSVGATAQVAPGAAPKLPGPVPLRAWTTDDFDDDSVRAIVPAAGRIYIGGRFTDVGPSASPLLVLRTGNGRQDTAFPQVSGGEVNAVEPDGHGGVYLGGYFTHVGRVACRALAHVRASGAVDGRFCPRPNGSVSVLAHSRGRLYFAGSFTRVQGARRLGLAAVSARTGRLTAWRPGRPNDEVRGLAVGERTVFAVGDFRSVGGREVHNVAALDTRTGRLRRWNARLDRSSCSTREPCLTSVGAVVIRGRAVYIAGDFDLVRGKTRIGLAALDARTGRPLKWRANVERFALSKNVEDWRLASAGRRIYVLGLFGKIRGTRRDGIAAVDARTGTVLPWRPRLADPDLEGADNVAVAGTAVVISFEDESETNAIKVVDARTGRKVRWKTRDLPGFLGRLAVSGRRVFAPSSAGVIGGDPRHNLAAFDPRSRRMTKWAPRLDPNGWVLAMAASATTLYVGGCFTHVNGQLRHSLAAFDLHTGRLLPWAPNADGCIWNLAVLGSTVYVAGPNVTMLGGAPRSELAAVDASTGAVRPWDPHPANSTGDKAEVSSLAGSGSTIYIGGHFTNVGGADRRNLAAVDAVTGTATAWDPRPDGNYVLAVEPGPDAVFVVGDFEHVGPTARRQLAAIDPTTGAATGFDPKARFNYVGEVGLVLRRFGQFLFIGGDHLEVSFAGKGAYGLATLDASTGRLLHWPLSGYGYPYALARAGSRLYVGGELEYAGSNGFLVFPF